METDAILMLSLALLGVADAELDRHTGRGLVARAQDWVSELAGYIKRKVN